MAPTDIDLVTLAKAAPNGPAFEDLLRRHQAPLRAFLRRVCGDAALADDLAQFSGETVIETASQPAASGVSSDQASPSLQKISFYFSLIGVVALLVVYGLMMWLGLPDWVFLAAVVLTPSGFPIVLYSSSIERKRHVMDSAERGRGRELDRGKGGDLPIRQGRQGGQEQSHDIKHQ